MKPPQALVLLNKKSGTLAFSGQRDEADRIARGFRAAGVAADVRFIDPGKADRAIAARPPGCTAVVVGGGDGTIYSVANAVADAPPDADGSRLALAVLPLGTHNHFAKELGVPEDLDAAVAAIAAALSDPAAVRPMDVGEVNGRLFLNFSGIGLHPRVVAQREVEHAQIKRFALLRSLLHKFTKPLALIFAFVRLLENLPILRLTLAADGRRMFRVTPSLIVCTNVHQIELLGLTEVSEPRRDVLNVYVARTSRVVGTVRMALAAITRRLKALREFEALAPAELVVYYRRPTLVVSLDGELVRLRTPLRYGVRKAGLVVVTPGGRSTATMGPG